MKEIPLTQDKVALVDDEDFELINQHKWYAVQHGNTWYAYRKNRERKSVLMHRQIAQPAEGMSIDHRDGNGLRNCRANLRECTHKQNMQNRRKTAVGKAIYKGVAFKNSKWQARIQAGGVYAVLGVFATPEEAARAYDMAARQKYGEFASLNGV